MRKPSSFLTTPTWTPQESRARALEALDNSIFHGRLLHVMATKPQSTADGKPRSKTTTTQDKKSLKQQRGDRRRHLKLVVIHGHGIVYLCDKTQDVPLYLEWAPEDILHPRPGIEGSEPEDAVGEQNLRSAILKQAVGVLEEEIDPERIESRSLFVKNLNFKTSDESLKDHFGKIMKCGSIKSVKVKKHLKNGKNLSMGFGFIEFDTVETTTNICRDAQGTILDGHALILQLCHTKIDAQALKKEGKDKSLTKLIVRNVAFEATEKDLRQLLRPFGQIKSLRLPMKLGSHRGFAFVEYFTKQEAQNALQALSSTHLYGRHLVLDRAKEGESLEELRARTAAQFVDEHSGFQKLSKKRKSLNILDEGNVRFSTLLD